MLRMLTAFSIDSLENEAHGGEDEGGVPNGHDMDERRQVPRG